MGLQNHHKKVTGEVLTSIHTTFYRGDYQSVIDQTIDSAEPHIDHSNLPFVIGSLSFVGRTQDVDALFKSPVFAKLSPDQTMEARFYQAIGMCRHSCYVEAAKKIFENFKNGRRESSRQRYYVFQGLGFYAFFKCRYAQAARFALRASEEALMTGFTHGRALSEDLRAHSLVHSGQVRAGLKSLRLAQKLAKRLGSGGLIRATNVSEKLYQAQHGILEKPILSLEKLLSNGVSQNNYTDTNLYLELANQLLLRGQKSEAERILGLASGKVFESRNRRHGALHNLRCATIAHHNGDFYQALKLIQAGLGTINRDIDRSLLLQLLCFERQINRLLGVENDPLKTQQISQLRQQVQRSLSWRAAQRRNETTLGPLPQTGEDPLGDLFDKAQSGGTKAVSSLVESGYLGLIPRALKTESNQKLLDLRAVPGAFLIIDFGEVRVFKDGFTPKICQLIDLLSHGPQSKEQLVERLWGYAYHPLRHDAMLYRLISRARISLGDRSDWIQSGAEGDYQIMPGVNVRAALKIDQERSTDHLLEPFTPNNEAALGLGVDTEPESMDKFTGIPEDLPAAHQEQSMRLHLSLNIRQIQTLEDSSLSKIIEPVAYRREFSVSAATARRDLGELVKLGFLIRCGSARATRYIYNGEHTAKLNRLPDPEHRLPLAQSHGI